MMPSPGMKVINEEIHLCGSNYEYFSTMSHDRVEVCVRRE